jgi:CheY-like chemotaxis protein
VTADALRGTRVLVVDDEPDGRALLRDVLVEWGAEVLEAESAAAARELVRRTPPDVLVSDIGMPLEDGYALLRSLRADGLAPMQLPAIALTAFARGEDRQRALAAGYQVHLAKPVDLGVLIGQVAALVRGAQGRRARSRR